MHKRHMYGLVLVCLVAACGKGDGVVKPTGHEPAGEVVALEGKAMARWSTTTDASERELEVGATVFADDTIVTTAGSSVTIRITHNQVLWNLGGDKRVALAESASWNAGKASGPGLLASGPDDQTAVAGRHAEKSAADTRATATRSAAVSEETKTEAGKSDIPTSPPAPPPPTPTPTPTPAAQPSPKPAPSPAAPPPPPAGPPGGGVPAGGDGAGSGTTTGYGQGRDYVDRGIKLGAKVSRKITMTSSSTVQGGLDKQAVDKVFKQHEAQMRYCYEVALADKPGLAGKVVVRLIVDAQGLVSKVDIAESTVENPALERCMVNKIKQWKFPAPKDGGLVTVRYPFIFKNE